MQCDEMGESEAREGKDMTDMRESRAFWAGIAIVVIFFMGTSVAYALSIPNGTSDTYGFGLLLAFAAFTLVGALIVARQPGNAIGWLFAGVGVLVSTGILATEYAHYGLVTEPGTLPAADWMAWYAGWFWLPMVSLGIVFPPLLFPTGRVLSRRWLPLLWLAIAMVFLGAMPTMFQATLELNGSPVMIDNPIGIAGVSSAETGFIGAIVGIGFLIAVGGGIVSMILRFRRSRGVERQQLKWFTFAATFLVLLPLGDVLPDLLGPLDGSYEASER